jgi:hypothetical protein
MKDLSVGLNWAWRIAAIEAGAAKFQFIVTEHIFIGICSLEKVLKLTLKNLDSISRLIKPYKANMPS